MTVDRSLKSRSKMTRGRNVLKREERLVAMALEERWEPGKSVFGLPKVRVLDAKSVQLPFHTVFGDDDKAENKDAE